MLHNASIPEPINRSRYIGGSDIGAICGYDEYRTPLDVWMTKTGRAPEFEGNAETRRGKALEPAILRMFCEESGIVAEDWNKHVIHPSISWAACTPDALCDGGLIGVEIKSYAGYYDEDSIIDKHFPAYLQCQWCMMCCGLESWYLAWVDSGLAVKWILVERNERVIEMTLQVARHFWEVNVCQDVRPDAIRPADYEKVKHSGYLPVGASILPVLEQYSDLGRQISRLAEEREQLANRIKMSIGSAEGITFAGKSVASWKADKRGNRILRVKI